MNYECPKCHGKKDRRAIMCKPCRLEGTTPKRDKCPTCDGQKDGRAKQCHPCQFKFNHPRWKRGWSFNANGYVTVPRNGRNVYLHRLIMEEHLGRKLGPKEHVHHKNGNRSDNRIENLEVLSAREHALEHSPRDKMVRMSALGIAALRAKREAKDATNL